MFAHRVDFAASQPGGIAIGDLDGDGKPEIVSPTLNGATIQIFRNTTVNRFSEITFAPPVSFESAVGPTQIQIADFDGDGKPDIAVAVSGTNSRSFPIFGIPASSGISIFRNTTMTTGAITFAPHVDFLSAASLVSRANSLTLADFDQDGKMDIASSVAHVLRNATTPGVITSSSFIDSSVPFSQPNPFFPPLRQPPFNFVTSADLNNDGAPDLVFVQNGFEVVLNSKGTTPSGFASNSTLFSLVNTSSPIKEISSFARLRDLDGDGLVDIVAGNSLGRSLSIRRNISNGATNLAFSASFQIPFGGLAFPIGAAPNDAEVADLDADGKLDLAAVNRQSNTISLIRNVSVPGSLTSNSFASKIDFPTAPFPNKIAVADLNGDSKMDIVIANSNSISVFRNQINFPPVADASATPVLVISPNNLNAIVALDGSRSSDPENDPLQFNWFAPGMIPLASGEITSAILPVGTNLITLVVDDGELFATNSVRIEVITAAQAIEKFANTFSSIVPRSSPLLATLRAAAASSDRGNFSAAINQLRAFQNKVRGQVANPDATLAEALVAGAQQIIDALVTPAN